MVTQAMREILFCVATMPEPYRHQRRDRLKQEYKKGLGDTHVREAFEVLIGEKVETEISERGRACYRSIRDRAARDLAAPS